jgi:hypothetical protein
MRLKLISSRTDATPTNPRRRQRDRMARLPALHAALCTTKCVSKSLAQCQRAAKEHSVTPVAAAISNTAIPTASRSTKFVVWLSPPAQRVTLLAFRRLLARNHPFEPRSLSLPRRSSHLSSSGVYHRNVFRPTRTMVPGRPAIRSDNNVCPSASQQARPSLA